MTTIRHIVDVAKTSELSAKCLLNRIVLRNDQTKAVVGGFEDA